MRRAALPIAVLLLAVLAAAAALARVGGGEPEAQAAAIATSGDFASLANSKEGTPIFAASAIGPGDSARGTVEIADTGSVPVELTLSRHDLLDSPGLGGGLLSGALALTVTDVTDPSTPLPIYAGPLASMPDQAAGRVEPGASRTYEFVATLPAGGGGDQNDLQAAAVSVAYAWTATEAKGEAPPSAPAPEPPAGSPPAGSPPAREQLAGAPPAAEPGAPLVLVVRKAARRLRGARLVVWARCDTACAISARGRLKASAAGVHRSAKLKLRPGRYLAGGQRLRIRVPAKLRLWLAETPGKRRLRAKLSFTAVGPTGGTDETRRNLALKPPRRR